MKSTTNRSARVLLIFLFFTVAIAGCNAREKVTPSAIDTTVTEKNKNTLAQPAPPRQISNTRWPM